MSRQAHPRSDVFMRMERWGLRSYRKWLAKRKRGAARRAAIRDQLR